MSYRLSVPFGSAEHRMLAYFERGTELNYKGRPVRVVFSGKPGCRYGEPKTDIYVLVDGRGGTEEIKISYKKSNANFLENKMGEERAEQIFGCGWRDEIRNATSKIKDKFLEKPLIYKSSYRRTQAGSITLGWKFELLNVKSGELSAQMDMSWDQVYDTYAGTTLTGEKRDALVNGRRIPRSGIADYIFMSDDAESAQDIIDQMIPIEEYVDHHPDVYFACKALNYRTFVQKYDSGRPLAVQVDWGISHDKLVSDLVFERPFERDGKDMMEQLSRCLDYLGILTTKDINSTNADMGVVHC